MVADLLIFTVESMTTLTDLPLHLLAYIMNIIVDNQHRASKIIQKIYRGHVHRTQLPHRWYSEYLLDPDTRDIMTDGGDNVEAEISRLRALFVRYYQKQSHRLHRNDYEMWRPPYKARYPDSYYRRSQ